MEDLIKFQTVFIRSSNKYFGKKTKQTKLEFSLLFSCVSNFLFCRTLTFLILYRTFLLQYKKCVVGGGPFHSLCIISFFIFFYKDRKVFPLYLHKEHRDMIQVQCEWIVSLCRTARRVRVIEDSRTRAHTHTHTSDQWETWEGKGGCICCHSDGRTAVLDTVTRQERESASE